MTRNFCSGSNEQQRDRQKIGRINLKSSLRSHTSPILRPTVSLSSSQIFCIPYCITFRHHHLPRLQSPTPLIIQFLFSHSPWASPFHLFWAFVSFSVLFQSFSSLSYSVVAFASSSSFTITLIITSHHRLVHFCSLHHPIHDALVSHTIWLYHHTRSKNGRFLSRICCIRLCEIYNDRCFPNLTSRRASFGNSILEPHYIRWGETMRGREKDQKGVSE